MLQLVAIPLAALLSDVAHLVHPTTLMQHAWINYLNGGCQAGTTISNDQLQVLAVQHALKVAWVVNAGELLNAQTSWSNWELRASIKRRITIP